MSSVNCSQLRTDLAETLNRVAYTGERIVIERSGKRVAALVPLKELENIEAREDAEDLAALKAGLVEAKAKGTMPLEEFIRQQEAPSPQAARELLGGRPPATHFNS